MRTSKLERLLNEAVTAINAAAAEAQRLHPGATLYLESDGTLHAMKPEPEAHKGRDPSISERQSLVFAHSANRAQCDVGAW